MNVLAASASCALAQCLSINVHTFGNSGFLIQSPASSS